MGGPDYIIQGVWPRNRALDGDEVAFFILPPNEWVIIIIIDIAIYLIYS